MNDLLSPLEKEVVSNALILANEDFNKEIQQAEDNGKHHMFAKDFIKNVIIHDLNIKLKLNS